MLLVLSICVCLGCSSLFPRLLKWLIFMHSSAVFCLSGHDVLCFCLGVLLAGIMVGLAKFASIDGLEYHLDMTEELFWSLLVEDGDGEMHVIVT